MSERVAFKSIDDDSLYQAYRSLEMARDELRAARQKLHPSEAWQSVTNMATYIDDYLLTEIRDELEHRDVCVHCPSCRHSDPCT